MHTLLNSTYWLCLNLAGLAVLEWTVMAQKKTLPCPISSVLSCQVQRKAQCKWCNSAVLVPNKATTAPATDHPVRWANISESDVWLISSEMDPLGLLCKNQSIASLTSELSGQFREEFFPSPNHPHKARSFPLFCFSQNFCCHPRPPSRQALHRYLSRQHRMSSSYDCSMCADNSAGMSLHLGDIPDACMLQLVAGAWCAMSLNWGGCGNSSLVSWKWWRWNLPLQWWVILPRCTAWGQS